MLKAPDSKIKGQLVVGETLLSPVGFGVGVTKLPGTAYISGPIMVGDTKSFVLFFFLELQSLQQEVQTFQY